jgi:hypothetical protein
VSNATLFGQNGDQIQGILFLGIASVVLIVDLIALTLLILLLSGYSHLLEETKP